MFFHPTRTTKVFSVKRKTSHFVLSYDFLLPRANHEQYKYHISEEFHEISISLCRHEKTDIQNQVYRLCFFNWLQQKVTKLVCIKCPSPSWDFNRFSQLIFNILESKGTIHLLLLPTSSCNYPFKANNLPIRCQRTASIHCHSHCKLRNMID